MTKAQTKTIRDAAGFIEDEADCVLRSYKGANGEWTGPRDEWREYLKLKRTARKLRAMIA